MRICHRAIRPTTVRAVGLAAILGGSGVLHFTTPAGFVSIVPASLPNPELLVAVSGAAELGCAVLLANSNTRAVGGLASAALLVAVFPAKISMALRSGKKSPRFRAIAWARLPLQIPLVLWALRIARESRG